MGATIVLSPQDCLVSAHNTASPLNLRLSGKGKIPTHPKKAIDDYTLPVIHSSMAFSTCPNSNGYSNLGVLSSRSLSTGSSDVFNPNPDPGFCSNLSGFCAQSLFIGGVDVPICNCNPNIRSMCVHSSQYVSVRSGDVHNLNPNHNPCLNHNSSNLRVLSTRSLSAGTGNVHNPNPNPKLVRRSKSASISQRNPILTVNPNPNPNLGKKVGGSRPAVENGDDIIMVSKGENGGGFRVSRPVAIPNGDKFLINGVERWAGPSFSVSPPPASLPLPTFLKPHLLEGKIEMLSPSPSPTPRSLPCQECTDFAFATRDLKRILNLDA